MKHRAATADLQFQRDFENLEVPAGAFDHRAHLRLAYGYLCQGSAESAHASMQRALRAFLAHLGIPDGKYHETMTRAWILAVRHFMQKTPAQGCADAFIDANPELLDSKIMLSHYSADLLFSTAARQDFVEPDIEPIPLYG
jgi:hypothetical protein